MQVKLSSCTNKQKSALRDALNQAGISISYNAPNIIKCAALHRAGWTITDFKGCLFNGKKFDCSQSEEYLDRLKKYDYLYKKDIDT